MKDYFSEVHNKINIVKQAVFRDLDRAIIPAGVNPGTDKKIITEL